MLNWPRAGLTGPTDSPDTVNYRAERTPRAPPLAVELARGIKMVHYWTVQTLQLSVARAQLGQIADEALAGKPVLIIRKGKLLSLAAYQAPEPTVRAPGYFDECYTDAAENRRELRRVKKRAYRKVEP